MATATDATSADAALERLIVERRAENRRLADMQQSQQIGEMIGTLNEVKANFVELKEEFGVTRALVRELQSDIALKFRTAETVFKTLKVLGLIAIAILTFKFGDIRSLWNTFFP